MSISLPRACAATHPFLRGKDRIHQPYIPSVPPIVRIVDDHDPSPRFRLVFVQDVVTRRGRLDVLDALGVDRMDPVDVCSSLGVSNYMEDEVDMAGATYGTGL